MVVAVKVKRIARTANVTVGESFGGKKVQSKVVEPKSAKSTFRCAVEDRLTSTVKGRLGRFWLDNFLALKERTCLTQKTNSGPVFFSKISSMTPESHLTGTNDS